MHPFDLVHLINFAQIVRPYDPSAVPDTLQQTDTSSLSPLHIFALTAAGVILLVCIVFFIRRSRRQPKH